MNRYQQRQKEYAAPKGFVGQEGTFKGPKGWNFSRREKFEKGADDFTYLGPGIGSIQEKDLKRLVSFHGFLTGGAFVGLQMLFLAKRLLNAGECERIHVQCETANCLPDPFQIIGRSTIGNKGLIIRDVGKLAVTITCHTPPGENARGVRLILDPKKTKAYPKLHAWYLNTEKVPHEVVVPILREVGDKVYSHKFVSVPVSGKKDKRVAICTGCGEPFVKSDLGDRRCVDCIH